MKDKFSIAKKRILILSNAKCFAFDKINILFLTMPNFSFIRWQIDLENALSNIDVDKIVYIFNNTVINISCNFIPHETVLFDDRCPPWMDKQIKKLILEKKNIFNCFRRKRKILFTNKKQVTWHWLKF